MALRFSGGFGRRMRRKAFQAQEQHMKATSVSTHYVCEKEGGVACEPVMQAEVADRAGEEGLSRFTRERS